MAENNINMDKNSLKFEIVQKKDLSEMISFFKEEDDSLTIPLSKLVDINEYAIKIINNGTVYSYKYNNKIVALIAFYTCEENNPKAYLTYICVNENYRKNNLGKKLMYEMEMECKRLGKSIIRLNTNINNEISQKFYLSLGYEKKETENNSYVYEKCIK